MKSKIISQKNLIKRLSDLLTVERDKNNKYLVALLKL